MIFGDNRLPQRFWDKVQPEPNTGCWIWVGAISRGRGVIRIDGENLRSYQMTCEIDKGPRPEGLHCSHLCHTGACVNPTHIIYETPAQNNSRNTGRVRRDRKYTELAHLPNDEYARKSGNVRCLTNYHKNKEAINAKRRTLRAAKKEKP